MENNTVTISIDEYLGLIEDRYDLSVISDVLFSTATLSWDKKSLDFNSSEVSKVVKYILRRTYTNKIAELKRAEEKAEMDGE